MSLPATLQPLPMRNSRLQAEPDALLRRKLDITVREARDALARMSATSPEHEHLTAGIDALLVRLGTVRDECALRARLASDLLRRGNDAGAQETLANIAAICGRGDERHALTMKAPSHGRPL